MPKQTYYITTAIDYPNAPPHIGHAYEKIIADFLARWHHLQGYDVFYLTGTDEHGQKIEKAAKKANKKPQHFVDELSQQFIELCDKLNLSNNTFIRTTEKKHVKTAQEIFTKVYDKGLIYKDKYTGLYCTGCEAFYLERELDDGNCPIHQRKAEQLSEESYFFKLSAFQDFLINHIEQHPDYIQPENKRNEILNRLQEPLKDLSVTRTTFNWGIQMPQDNKHILYVWFDALINYLSGIAYPTTKFDKYWPANCHLIGKDIVWFHTVIWGAMLNAADLPLPKTVYCHGFLTVDGHKMSKSLGNVVDPAAIVDKYGADPLRYVLLRDVPAGEDGDFSEQHLINRNNADLADALGNLLQRTSVLIHKHYNGTIPACGPLTDAENQLNKHIPDLDELNTLVAEYKWHHAVERIWQYIHQCNKYINDTEPWKQTQNTERLATILYTIIEHLRIISILIWPIIPASAEQLAHQIGQPIKKLTNATFTTKTQGDVLKPEILFTKMEHKQKQHDPFSAINLKVGNVVSVKDHPNADKLYIVTIDAGTEQRQLVAGMKAYYTPDELTGKHIIFVSNLKPAKLRGVESQGMLLAAEKGKTVKVLEAPHSNPGDQVRVDGITPGTAEITIDDFAAITLTTKNNTAVYNDKPLTTEHGAVTVDIADGAKI